MDTSIYLLFFIVVILTLVSLYKIFEKTGHAGWKAFIPIYNLFIIQDIIKKPWWWILLMLIPFLGIIWSVWATYLLAKSFGKDIIFSVGLILFPYIFYPILAFGNNTYTEPHEQHDNTRWSDSDMTSL